jgi:hypothetical protein
MRAAACHPETVQGRVKTDVELYEMPICGGPKICCGSEPEQHNHVVKVSMRDVISGLMSQKLFEQYVTGTIQLTTNDSGSASSCDIDKDS